MMSLDASELEIARQNISRAERRVAERQSVLEHLASRGLSSEFAARLIKTFEEDLAVSRANLARLQP